MDIVVVIASSSGTGVVWHQTEDATHWILVIGNGVSRHQGVNEANLLSHVAQH